MKQTLPERPYFILNNSDNYFLKKYRENFAVTTDAEFIYMLKRNKLKPNCRIVVELLSQIRKNIAEVEE